MKLSRSSSLLTGLSTIFVLLAWFFPVWSIRLCAPQYPEGLGMNLWMNHISGINEFDIANMNLLNHYIGMAAIDENSIKEFHYTPYIIGVLCVITILNTYFKKTILLYFHSAFVVFFGLIGLADFWYWGYSYGHNLDPHASIQFPGMNYQPPLLGCKEILNITACSYPNIGALLLFLAGVSLGISIIIALKCHKKKGIVICD